MIFFGSSPKPISKTRNFCFTKVTFVAWMSTPCPPSMLMLIFTQSIWNKFGFHLSNKKKASSQLGQLETIHPPQESCHFRYSTHHLFRCNLAEKQLKRENSTTLPETNSSQHLKIGLNAPKGNARIPTIHFQVLC